MFRVTQHVNGIARCYEVSDGTTIEDLELYLEQLVGVVIDAYEIEAI